MFAVLLSGIIVLSLLAAALVNRSGSLGDATAPCFCWCQHAHAACQVPLHPGETMTVHLRLHVVLSESCLTDDKSSTVQLHRWSDTSTACLLVQ
jgi:hypothetical protein